MCEQDSLPKMRRLPLRRTCPMSGTTRDGFGTRRHRRRPRPLHARRLCLRASQRIIVDLVVLVLITFATSTVNDALGYGFTSIKPGWMNEGKDIAVLVLENPSAPKKPPRYRLEWASEPCISSLRSQALPTLIYCIDFFGTGPLHKGEGRPSWLSTAVLYAGAFTQYASIGYHPSPA